MLTDFGKSNPNLGRMRSHNEGVALKVATGVATMLLVAVTLT
jgi:hypothetical protein